MEKINKSADQMSRMPQNVCQWAFEMFFLCPLLNIIKFAFSILVLSFTTIPTFGYFPIYQAVWLLTTPMFSGFIYGLIRVYYFGFVVQTKQDLLCTLGGLSLTSFCWNLTEILYSNAIVDLSVCWHIFFHFGQCFYSFELNGTPVKLFYKPGKVIVNLYHLSLINTFFLITAQLISPYAVWYNWTCHLFAFWMAIEASLVLCSREFELDNPCVSEDCYDMYLGTVHTW